MSDTLADLFTNAAGFRDAMRDAVGYPENTVNLPDTTIDTARKKAFSRLKRDFYAWTYASFSTVADQQSYSPLPSGGIAIKRVFWPIPALCRNEWNTFEGRLFEYSEVTDESGYRMVRDPMPIILGQRNAKLLRDAMPAGAHIVDKEVVYLDPVPSAVTTVWFSYTYARWSDYLDVDGSALDAFQDLVEAMLHERLSAGSAAITQLDDRQEGSSVHMRSPQHHMELSKQKMVDYQGARPPIRMGW
ncbi:MAG: hypothetical protein GY871_04540 [Actinomycetales bacterium]|nr:hypothetical protein [Actinomycetales bacterium]